MLNISIEIVAWWGAIVATIVLAWDFFKWKVAGPKIRATATMQAEHKTAGDLKEYETEVDKNSFIHFCHIEVINTGTLPTTIFNLTSIHKEKKGSFSITNPIFTPTSGKNLPVVLGPGEMWTCRIKAGRIRRNEHIGKPIISIKLSHMSKPLEVKVIDNIIEFLD